ncbi:hypothetical protein RUND412_004980 [Rhizina undulata]
MDRLHHHHHRLQQQQQQQQAQQHHQHQQQSQHPGIHQIDPQLQQPHHLSAAPHQAHHPLRPLQSASGVSSSPSTAYHHPHIAPHPQPVGGAGGPLAQARPNPTPVTSGPSASSMQQYHPLAPHPPPQSHPPTQLQQQSHPQAPAGPSQQSLQSLPPPQPLPQQHVQQRITPIPLRPMPPPSSVPPNQQGQSPQMGIVSNQMARNAGVAQQTGIGGGRRVLPSGGISGPTSTGIGPVNNSGGIINASSGRSSANTGITPGATSQITPVKDQDGKFPCPHCPKTYLHAKHLKRHLLRHTGDRPYQCVLCKDTFSRSDILKRHFQKCSIRRGNPTGATHLSHAHAHQQGKQGNNQNANTGNSVSPSMANAGVPPIQGSPTMGGKKKSSGKACDECVRLKVRCDLGNPCERCQTRGCECAYSRSAMPPKRTGIKNEAGGIMSSPDFPDQSGQASGYSENFNFPPPTHAHPHMTHSAHQQQQHTLPSSHPPQQPHPQATNNNLQQPRTTGNLPPSQGPPAAAFYGNQPPQQQSEVDWSSFMQVGDANFMDPFYLQSGGPTTGDSGTPTTTASMDPSIQASNGGMYNMLFPGGPAGVANMGGMMGGFSGWTNLAVHQIDPLQAKCNQLIVHCFSENPARGGLVAESPNQRIKQEPGRDETLKVWLTPDNVKHFVRLFFANFQGHFPLIHIPTFNVQMVYDGLLLVIVCIGAVYSSRGITIDKVRILMDKTLAVIDRNEQHRAATSRRMQDGRVGIRTPELEEIQAMILFHIISTWHGNHLQRENSKRQFPRVIQLAREANLFQPVTAENCGHLGPSIHHQLGSNETGLPQAWNWLSWVEQEKRNRALYAIYLLDTAFVIFFNNAPHIRLFDIKLTLPADDAPWEASNPTDCANMLGLNGEELSKNNVTGTRRVKQPEFIVAVEALLQYQLEFNPGSTNAYSKFILIHALHVHIWSSQRMIASSTEQANFNGGQVPIDWKMDFIVGNGQSAGSGRGTPEGFLDEQNNGQPLNEMTKFVKLTAYTLEKWKRAWDADLPAQYPSQTSRIGFCRDAVPFYWLAKLFLARNRTTDWRHSGDDDQTVLKVKNMLKHVRTFITDDGGRSDTQGAVCSIDESYGMDELTYDMKLLFKPIEESARSPPHPHPVQESSWPGNVGVSGPQR